MRALWLVLLAGLAHAHAGDFDGSHPLSVATRDAVVACSHFEEAWSLERCAEIVGKTPEHVKARKAVGRIYSARQEAMDECKEGIQRCTWRVDGLMQVGINQAWEKQARR